jgi:hypothetical protein
LLRKEPRANDPRCNEHRPGGFAVNETLSHDPYLEGYGGVNAARQKM